jgi:hypothetical protein
MMCFRFSTTVENSAVVTCPAGGQKLPASMKNYYMFAIVGEPLSCRQRLLAPRRMDRNVPGESNRWMSQSRRDFSSQSD